MMQQVVKDASAHVAHIYTSRLEALQVVYMLTSDKHLFYSLLYCPL